MSEQQHDVTVVDEVVWKAWVQKGRLLDEASARQTKRAVAVLLACAAIGYSTYLLIVK